MIHPSDRETDGRTDRRATAYTRYSIYAVAHEYASFPLLLLVWQAPLGLDCAVF